MSRENRDFEFKQYQSDDIDKDGVRSTQYLTLQEGERFIPRAFLNQNIVEETAIPRDRKEKKLGIYLHNSGKGKNRVATSTQWKYLAKWLENRDVEWGDIYSVYTDFDTLLTRLRLFKYLWILEFEILTEEEANKLQLQLKKKRVTIHTFKKTYQPSYWLFTEELKPTYWYQNRLKND